MEPKKPDSAGTATTERRKTQRFTVFVPVEVSWRGDDGTTIKETARAKNVSADGALLEMSEIPPAGAELELTNSLTTEKTSARVVGIRKSKEGGPQRVAVSLLAPSETFWGVPYQLQKISAQLIQLEQEVKSRGTDIRILREFHDAVDYLRLTAAGLQQWQELELRGQDAFSVLTALGIERIRRATRLINELTMDLDAMEIANDSTGVVELQQAIEGMRHRLMGSSGSARLERKFVPVK